MNENTNLQNGTATNVNVPEKKTNTYYKGNELISLNLPPVPYIVEDLVRDSSLTLLAGEEGSGKSLIALNMGISVACNLDNFLGHRISKSGIVLFLNNELAFGDHVERFKKNVSVLSPEAVTKLEKIICPDTFPPFPEYAKELEAKIIESKPILVILDCLYWAHNKKENDSTEMKAMMRLFDHLRKKYKIAFVVVHHTKKESKNGKMHNDDIRGSGVFAGVADQVIQIRRSSKDEALRLLKSTKTRHGSDKSRKARLLSLDENTLWFRDEGEAVEEEHLPVMGEPIHTSRQVNFKSIFSTEKSLSRKQIIEKSSSLGVSVDKRTIDRQLQKAVSRGELSKEEYGTYVLVNDKIAEEVQKVSPIGGPPSVETVSTST